MEPSTSERALPEGALGTESSGTPHEFALSDQQVHFFETFGFVRLPGLFAPEIELIAGGFEEVFAANTPVDYHHDLHFGDLRETVGPGFVDRSPKLAWLRSDPRILAIVETLVGVRHNYNESDGNYFSCDTGWHSDVYGVTNEGRHIKIYFYLDELRRDTGALRVIPGTQGRGPEYAELVRGRLWDVNGPVDEFGVAPPDIPSWTVETDPGDVIVGNYLTLHATFGGAPKRRLFTMNYSERPDGASEHGAPADFDLEVGLAAFRPSS
jgi:hypothetical protein